ncbi:hypothetical protein FGB62_48g143 [Gracilaria domingensis]|nr:hypothetical protein FGB62_48g143 [Gracilaria domingensis]
MCAARARRGALLATAASRVARARRALSARRGARRADNPRRPRDARGAAGAAAWLPNRRGARNRRAAVNDAPGHGALSSGIQLYSAMSSSSVNGSGSLPVLAVASLFNSNIVQIMAQLQLQHHVAAAIAPHHHP